MRSATHRALLISLCLHLIIAFIVTVFMVRQPLESEFMDLLVVDMFSVQKAHQLPPKIKVKPVAAVPRYQIRKTHRVSPPKARPVDQIEGVLPRTQAVAFSHPRHRINTAQIAHTTRTDLSTAVRDLRTDTAAFRRTEAATPTATGGRGLNTIGAPEPQRSHNRTSILETLEEQVEGDIVVKGQNLIRRGSLPQIGFDEVIANLAKKIVESSEGGPIDVVFVIDASGSMGDNIRSVARHLSEMIDVYKSAKIDYALGLTEFWAAGKPPRNEIRVLQLTKNMREYQREIQRIAPRQDENALDAMDQTVREMRFRATSRKHLILVTDEPFTSLKGLTLNDVIALCREFAIHVNLLGLNTDEHRRLAAETDGNWHVIPRDAVESSPKRKIAKARRSRRNARTLRNAQWTRAAEIGKASLKNLHTNALDVILFIDASGSMEAKLPKFLGQLEGMIRDWDNALIAYRIGVVRFRSRAGAFNYVNVFQPPQTLDDIRKIVNLPCQGSEMLLDAIVEGMRKIKLRPDAQPYLIVVTDEPSTGGHSPEAVIQLCLEAGAKVGVIGTFDLFQQRVAMKTDGIWVPIPDGKTINNLNW